MVLLSETANSLVNPVEGLVLAHQPINGATYTAAKLTHLLRVLAYTVPALNLLPALAGLFCPKAPWTYPLLHFSLPACSAGDRAFCCAFFGWLIRFFPPARLKTIGQIAEGRRPCCSSSLCRALPALCQDQSTRRCPCLRPGMLLLLGIALRLPPSLGVIFGLRALSGDYLVRVSAIVHGASHARPRRAALRWRPPSPAWPEAPTADNRPRRLRIRPPHDVPRLAVPPPVAPHAPGRDHALVLLFSGRAPPLFAAASRPCTSCPTPSARCSSSSAPSSPTAATTRAPGSSSRPG